MITNADGASYTLLAAEAGEPVPWTKPDDLPYDPNKPLPKLGGLFSDGYHVVFCDGSVRFVKHKFNEKIMRWLITYDDGQPARFEDLNR
jgi:hypothetical protein